jgi:hypothetical protein
MSDASQGPGWWQASDGQWYPPETATDEGALFAAESTPIVPQAGVVRKAALTAWEGIWYVIQNIAFGAGYLAKVPAKKALQDFGLVEMTGAEQFWYVLMCVGFGAGYFAKIPIAKALSELPQYQAHPGDRRGPIGTPRLPPV